MSLRPPQLRASSSLRSEIVVPGDHGGSSSTQIDELDPQEELKVTFYPELFLQRRIWVLDILRKKGTTKVLDVGCGEGQLLTVLCQPAPWLLPPPESILPPSPIQPTSPSTPAVVSPTYNSADDDIPNLHPTLIHGLDISDIDLKFAVQGTAVPPLEDKSESEGAYRSYFIRTAPRWEEMTVKIWKGGLEVFNPEFVDIECIVAMEVIEHLPPAIFSAFAPSLFGTYHPQYILLTTPSYTYNARFTAPHAPRSARRGYPDPTNRTDRIFRHDDHQFEWTNEEFESWCRESAEEWGYEIEVMKTIGRALEPDPYQREDELGGASCVACFRRIESVPSSTRESKAQHVLGSLASTLQNPTPHNLLATHFHTANAASQKPQPLPGIAGVVKSKMEFLREAIMRVEELWFETDIAVACGGWIEFLVRAVEESPDLTLKRDDAAGALSARNLWSVEIIGGVENPRSYWPEEGVEESEMSADLMPPDDWTPGEGTYSTDEDTNDEDAAADGDVSWGPSASEADDTGSVVARKKLMKGSGAGAGAWGIKHKDKGKAAAQDSETDSDWDWGAANVAEDHQEWGWGHVKRDKDGNSTAGWDGDESDDTT
ncbi:hypothetical protein BDQ17DRAFT_1478483 [Cyathus striatus]|nr:hypothetical protein BDQ17DRAFT_1478483 [Cyathus striatus]